MRASVDQTGSCFDKDSKQLPRYSFLKGSRQLGLVLVTYGLAKNKCQIAKMSECNSGLLPSGPNETKGTFRNSKILFILPDESSSRLNFTDFDVCYR